MSKKMIILIQLAVCVIAIIVISLYGRNPENWRDFNYCESLYFLVDDSRVPRGYEIELENDTETYQLIWFVGPENATIKTVRFLSYNENVLVDENGLVTFLSDEGATIYIYTTDNSLLSSEIMFSFLLSEGGDLPF